MSRLAVIGLDGSTLSQDAAELLERATLVAGGKRHLAAFAVEPDRSVAFEGDLSDALSRIEAESGPVVVLASGDPGSFGIVRMLAQRFGSEALRVVPAVSSVALAFARVGISWDDAATVSAHGREPRRATNVCRAHPKVAVLTSPDFGPAELAGGLASLGRTFVVAERLGEVEEKVFRGTAAEVSAREWEDPNVVLVIDEKRRRRDRGWISSGTESSGRWALPEDEFEHRSGMITKSPTRALVLSRLGPGPGDLVWDVGAGSGSVAIECARLGSAAIAIERDPESCARLRRNAERHGVDVSVIEGEAPGALQNLPEPDAVFVGGTGAFFEEIVKLCAVRARRSVVLALVGLERVVPAGKVLEDCGLEVESTFLQASPVQGVGPMHRVAPESAVFVVCGSRP